MAVTVAGSDSGGGAGVQADLRTMAAHAVFGTSVVTSVTAQHTRGVESTHTVPPGEVDAQFAAVADDFDLQAGKTGMLATAPVVERVTRAVRETDAPFVVDPVMVAASGDRLLDPDAEDAYEALLAESTVVTPNADEVAVLTDREPTDAADLRRAGDDLVARGARAALCKGGHVASDPVRDVLVVDADRAATPTDPTVRVGSETRVAATPTETAAGNVAYTFEHARIDTTATHGSGCTLSSAIAARLARDASLVAAVAGATQFVTRAVRYPFDVGEGPGAVNGSVVRANEAARHATREAGERVLARLIERDVSNVVPEVGTNVVAATPYAERVDETAAIEGRLTRTLSGVAAPRGLRFGASSHVARFLLAARETDPTLRFAANCRFDERVERAMDELGWTIVELDRTAEPDPDHEGSTMGWAARRAMERATGAADTDGASSQADTDGGSDDADAASDDTRDVPHAVFDRGDVGKESMTRLLARDADALADRVIALSDRV